MKKIVLFVCVLVVSSTSSIVHATESFTTKASWYGQQFQGRRMANGEPFNMHDPTIAAHRTLPFGTRLLVENPRTGRSQIVVVKDRGPYTRDPGRSLDLSRAAADRLGYTASGVAHLTVTVLGR